MELEVNASHVAYINVWCYTCMSNVAYANVCCYARMSHVARVRGVTRHIHIYHRTHALGAPHIHTCHITHSHQTCDMTHAHVAEHIHTHDSFP